MTSFDMTLTQKIVAKYVKAKKKEKSRILADYCTLTGIKRNTAIRRLLRKRACIKPRALKNNNGRKRGPKKIFGQRHTLLVSKCWELAGEICAERLFAMLGEYIEALRSAGSLACFNDTIINQVKRISLGTLKNIVAQFPRTNYVKKHKGNPEIYKFIPVKANFGQYSNILGNVEVDYVEHSGGCGSGIFGITACYVDIYSGWLARASALSKTYEAVRKTHKINLGKIHHPIKEYHPDNAKTILSVLLEKAKRELNPDGDYDLSRSRPYKKNDNAHVEQKNGDKVRRLVGYHRYDTKKEISLLNRLYAVADLYDNFFIASAKVKEKVRDLKGRVIRVTHDNPKTPYKRIIECDQTPVEIKQKLTNIYTSLDMVKLKIEMDALTKELINLVAS